jgi:hypothetical protein
MNHARTHSGSSMTFLLKPFSRFCSRDSKLDTRWSMYVDFQPDQRTDVVDPLLVRLLYTGSSGICLVFQGTDSKECFS